MVLRPFTDEDKEEWAEAEDFPDGEVPLIGETRDLEGNDTTVIVDAGGIGVYMFDSNMEEVGCYQMNEKNEALCTVIVHGLSDPIDPEELVDVGFEEIG